MAEDAGLEPATAKSKLWRSQIPLPYQLGESSICRGPHGLDLLCFLFGLVIIRPVGVDITKDDRNLLLQLFQQRAHELSHLRMGRHRSTQLEDVAPLTVVGRYHDFGLQTQRACSGRLPSAIMRL